MSNNDSDSEYGCGYDHSDYDQDENVDYIPEEEYRKMLDNPILLPIHYWEKITEIKQFVSDPDIGTGTFYYGDSPFGAGNFIDLDGELSQCRPTAEGGWKRECYQTDYKLIFREYENEKYMYVADKIPYSIRAKEFD
jgi:hypothetical protein